MGLGVVDMSILKMAGNKHPDPSMRCNASVERTCGVVASNGAARSETNATLPMNIDHGSRTV